jgi:hypothetical protein
MNHIKLFMALLAACILIMPALSMPDNGKCASSDGNLACSACHKLIANENGGCHSQAPIMGPATDNAREQFCKLCKESMMVHDGKDRQGCDCEKSMTGWDGKDKQGGECQRPMMGHDGKDKQGCGCEKSMMGHDGKDKQGCGCEKSMMGEKGKEGNGEVKVVIISVKP